MDKRAPNLALSRLLQLASPMLPVGAYSYSQGMEWAVESGDVCDLYSALGWIGDALDIYMGRYELPLLYRMAQAWQADDAVVIRQLDAYFQSGRDSAESYAETRQMGYSLSRLLNALEALPQDFVAKINALEEPAFPTIYAGIVHAWGIPQHEMLQAYAWSWIENQVSAAMKTVPLGQVAGQKILLTLGSALPRVVEQAMRLPDCEISNCAPGLTIAGCRHETQYSRLFRS